MAGRAGCDRIMDIPDYKEKYGEPQRTLHHFNYFVSSLIFGESQYEDFKRAYPEGGEIPVDGSPEYFKYAIWKGSAEDSLKIYKKYHDLYSNDNEHCLLTYARAFMEYCETEYGEMTAD